MLFTPVHQSLGKEARHFPSPYDGQGRASASVENSLPSLSPELHLGCHELFVRNKAVHNIHNQALSLGWHIKHEAPEPITRAI